MVKIKNPLGDVKIGRQGEVVYQRKYGEQIRRGVSPKRAIASQAQIAHRQLYRDALAWRSELSRPNRRYLEGYTYANGVVDSYHIPLGWSKFALKLYLEKVKFIVAERRTEYLEGERQRHEYYHSTGLGISSIRSITWEAQSFTPQDTHRVTGVKLMLRRTGNPGQLIVGIRATNGAGEPTGSDLCVGTIDGNALTLNTAGAWYEITLGAGAPLNPGTKYAIVARAPDGDTDNRVQWKRDSSGSTYPRGCMLSSSDSGESWTPYPDLDHDFEEWGTVLIEVKKATIHIKHPALSTVVQKRGELIVQAYEGLSSLDEEYLTKQVGLDVEERDFIEATTLPGIEYSYLVK